MRKTQKAAARKRGGRLTVADQQRIATWAHDWLAAAGGKLYAPAVRDSAVPNSYEMEVVDTNSDPWFLVSVPADLAGEVAAFQAAARTEAGVELWDCEFYTQPGGRVAVLDWDQCRLV
ncbi:MAG: hypothetical protein ACRC1H_02790 [Caldilineaceae bacterium]